MCNMYELGMVQIDLSSTVQVSHESKYVFVLYNQEDLNPVSLLSIYFDLYTNGQDNYKR